MSLGISRLSENITQSEIRNMSIECDRLKGINMSQGVCDLDLHSSLRQGVIEGMDSGENHYTRYDGIHMLRKAIAEKLASYNQIHYDPENEIIVSAGATGAFYSTCLALLNPGDEVILFEPYYGYHESTILAAGGTPKFVSMKLPDWSFDLKDLEDQITKKTKAILICSPGNPSGKVFSLDEINLIGNFAIKHDLFIFTDEIYEYFIYDDKKHISPASLDFIKDRTITISGFSKTFSITGWRIGYVACHKKWAQMIGYINDLIYVCASSPLQYGVAKGLSKLPPDYYKNLANDYYFKRQKICQTLNKIGIKPIVPQGAYYILADVSILPGKNSKDKAMFLLQASGVATVPGSAFYKTRLGDNLVRFCFAKSDTILEEACQKLLKL
jgi:aminotransferase